MINMKCPICGKDLDLQNKQIGTSENGDPIFNEYAICHSCKKQWNLDKQRAKKIAAKKAAEEKAKAEAIAEDMLNQAKLLSDLNDIHLTECDKYYTELGTPITK